MSFQNNPLVGGGQLKAGVVPIHRSAGYCEGVFLCALGDLSAPVSDVDMDKVREFLNDNLGTAKITSEGVGDAALDGLFHLPDSKGVECVMSSFTRFVADNQVSTIEMQRMVDLAVGFLLVMRLFDGSEKKVA